MAQWLVRPRGFELDSFPRWAQKILDGREPSEYVNFRMTLKGQQFHTPKHTIQRQEQHNNISYKCFTRWNLISLRSQKMALIYILLLRSNPMLGSGEEER